MTTAFSAAQKDRLDLSVSIALGSAAQIALFVAPLLVLLSLPNRSRADGPRLLARCGRHDADRRAHRIDPHDGWKVGVVPRVLVLMVYAIFGVTLYVMPPMQ